MERTAAAAAILVACILLIQWWSSPLQSGKSSEPQIQTDTIRQPQGDTYANLLSFVSQRGGNISGSEITDGPPRGLIASETLAKGSVVVRLPTVLLVTEHIALQTDLAKDLIATAPQQEGKNIDWKGLVLIVWLLSEQSRLDSPWKPYLASLPTWHDFASHPQVLSDVDARLCVAGGADALKKLKARNTSMEEEFELLSSLPSWRFSLQEFQWARLVLLTRGFTVPAWYLDTEAEMNPTMKDGKRTKRLKLPGSKGARDVAVVLAPFADMLNHNRRPNAAWRYTTADGFVIETSKSVAKGEEILLSYGDKSNEALLLEYGFAGWLSQHDLVTVNLEKEGQLHPMQLSLKPIAHDAIRKIMSFLRSKSNGEDQSDLTKEQEVHSLQLLHDTCSASLPASNPGSRLPGCAAYLNDRADLVGICTGFATRGLAILAEQEESLPPLGDSILDRLTSLYIAEWLRDASVLLPRNRAKALQGRYGRFSAAEIMQEVLGF
eukprot:gnl/MRDRNA2_/MRDRNA2_111127_c0_seq1.p1 gnl/MRDRNA2_/MRDRNA2_111127_c0~~gnl/MRDRNA2_/MRDRNA2_111127_c0_seq1.p1  ORF type:complete len:538 (-),score=83.00 gnl/MRDRNA2_/MRDRNA2_111127_c0_seq1:118-1596(-)